MKNKIAVIGLKGLPAYGGAATVGENIIEQLKDNYDFTVYSTSLHTHLKTGNYKDICYQKVFKAVSLKKLNSLLYYIRAAFHVFFKKYDLVHLHHRDAAFIVPFLKLKCPVLLTTHGITGRAKKWRRYKWFFDLQLKYFVPLANKVTCVSKNEKRGLQNIWNINAEYIPNGINNKQIINIKKGFLPSPSNTSKNNNYITFAAGRIIEFKGLDILLKAIKLIKNPPTLKIIGDINHENDYRILIEKLAEGINIEFLGLIKNKKKLFEIISNSLFFVFPSRQEAMSIMLLEVASLQVPIIASDIVENKDVFSKEDVLFFESESVTSLAKKIEWALANKHKLNDYSKRAFNKLLRDYSWDAIAIKYSAIYKELIK